MNRRRRPTPSPSANPNNEHSAVDSPAEIARGGSVPKASGQQVPATPTGSCGDSGFPSDTVRTLLSIWLPLHLFAVFISITAVVEPSTVHARLLSLLRPYLQLTHFDADDRPLYLAHGEPSEQPHRLQVSSDEINNFDAAQSDQNWTTIEPIGRAGFAESDRYFRWLSTAATLAEHDQPGLVAELLLPIVQSDESIRAVRIIRLPTDLNSTVDESLIPPYSARVIRDQNRVSLVQLQSARLSAEAVRKRGSNE